jgi:hypothetical protein
MTFNDMPWLILKAFAMLTTQQLSLDQRHIFKATPAPVSFMTTFIKEATPIL